MPGRTVLLTTHYMAEADELCERIAIVDHGRILALGTPDELKRRVQRESVFRIELDRLDGGAGDAPAAAGRRSARPRRPRPGRGPASARRSRSTSPSPTTRRWARSSARSAGAARTSSRCASREPSLEDVFVELVGRGFDEEALDETDVERDSIDHDDSDDPPAPDRTPDPRDTAHEPGEREEQEAVV